MMKASEKLRQVVKECSIAECRYQNYDDQYCVIKVGDDKPNSFFVGYCGDYSVSEFGYAYCAIIPKNLFSYRELKALEREYNVTLL